MTPEKHKNLAECLKNMRAARNLSLAEFSRELDIPKSTLQSIMEDGQTSLHTAVHISEKLGIPLDILINRKLAEEQLRTQDSLVNLLNWCSKLSKTQMDDACTHMDALIQLIRESCP